MSEATRTRTAPPVPEDVDKLEKRVRELVKLPTLPSVMQRVSMLTENVESSATEVADVIAADQVLSAKILRFVNSPVYGFPGRISSIKHAVVLLGFNVVKGLVLGTTIFETLGHRGRELWNHSLGCAILSRHIGRATGLPDVEEVMTAGLLHDIGKVILIYMAEAEWEEAAAKAERESLHIATAERAVFGADHARVANWIATKWRFPNRLIEPLTYHHQPRLAKEFPSVTGAVHVADILARGMGYGYTGDNVMPQLHHESFDALGVSFEQIETLLAEAEGEYEAGADMFSMESAGDQPMA
ncbi:MAG: HDOD domain-containing protein [Candidatus Hydrogenedentota bacterium]